MSLCVYKCSSGIDCAYVRAVPMLKLLCHRTYIQEHPENRRLTAAEDLMSFVMRRHLFDEDKCKEWQAMTGDGKQQAVLIV